MGAFKLTYSTMFAPPRELHDRFAAAVERTQGQLGQTHGFRVGGSVVQRAQRHVARDPADQRRVLGEFSVSSPADVEAAVAAARYAFAGWRATPWRERVALLMRVARLIDERLYDIAAAVSLEVGKNRMEALGEVAEVSAFFDLYAQQMADHAGYDQRVAGRSAARLQEPQPQRAQALWRVGGGGAVQLPLCAGRRPGGRCAGGRQHRGAQGRAGHAVVGGAARPVPARRRPAARGVQLPDRRQRHRQRADRP